MTAHAAAAGVNGVAWITLLGTLGGWWSPAFSGFSPKNASDRLRMYSLNIGDEPSTRT